MVIYKVLFIGNKLNELLGTLLLGRCKDENGKSLLYKRRTTSVPKALEQMIHTMTFMKYDRRFRTYEVYCEDEIKTFLENPTTQYQVGPKQVDKANAYNDTTAFINEDSNYLSARAPADSYFLTKKLIDKLYSLS